MVGIDAEVGVEIEQVEYQLLKRCVEIDQEGAGLAVNLLEVVSVEFEIGAVLIGRNERMPMEGAPAAVVGDADVAHRCFGRATFAFGASLDGDGEGERAVARCDDAAVAVGLLDVVVAMFLDDGGTAVQFGEVEDGRKIGRCKSCMQK